MLRRVNNPECPACGCNASTIITRGRGTRTAKDGDVTNTIISTRRCDNDQCGRLWTHSEAEQPAPAAESPPAPPPRRDGVTYYVIRCPKCQSKRTKVTSTRKPIRLHKCLECQNTFKSVEAEAK